MAILPGVLGLVMEALLGILGLMNIMCELRMIMCYWLEFAKAGTRGNVGSLFHCFLR